MGVSESYDLPVSRMAVIEFAEIWSYKYDPRATTFMPIERLDELLIDISKSKVAKELLVVPDFIKESKAYRKSVIKQLEIPTFGTFSKITFHDTL